MTIIGGDYEPVPVERLDLVGYAGDGKFVILNPVKSHGRKLPLLPADDPLSVVPNCIRARVENNQVVNFNGEVATLHDIAGAWHVRFISETGDLKPLASFTFFEIGNTR